MPGAWCAAAGWRPGASRWWIPTSISGPAWTWPARRPAAPGPTPGRGRAGRGAGGAGREPVLSAGARLLSRWRDGRIDLQGGTLRWPLTGAPLPLTLNLRHAQLRRQASSWSADALVLLPASLGASAHLALAVTGDPARPAGSSGTLSFEGRMLEFAGWRGLIDYAPLQRYLPQAGRGNLQLHTEF